MLRKTLLSAVSLATIAVAVPVAPVFAQSAPGSYKEWNKIDSVTIVQSFKLADYDKAVIAPLAKGDIALPAESDNTYAPTKKMLDSSDMYFIEGLGKGFKDHRKDFTVEAGSSGGAKVLLVRGRLTKLSAGSQAARVFGGFGAGAGAAKIAIDVVDAASGKVLARMTHEARVGRGGYDRVMSKALSEVGETFGKGMKGF